MTLHQTLRDQLEYTAEFRRVMHEKTHPELAYFGIEDFVLREGRDMHLTPTKPKLRKSKAKQCFRNAALHVTYHPECRYVEGYVLTPNLPIPIHHAWVLNAEGQVLDSTLGWREGAAYIGVSFDTHLLLRLISRNKHYGLFDSGGGLTPLVLGNEPGFMYQNRRTA